jgi:tRNA 2-thiocytidine biosynthesis protein TtcA
MNRRIGRAMHDYDMLADGDRVLIAVSGGIDSLVLAWLLAFWRKKAPVRYALTALHVDMAANETGSPGVAACLTRKAVEAIGLSIHILPARWRPDPLAVGAAISGHDLCFQCARSRRTQLFAYAQEYGYNRIALGHHRDDLIETFLLNLTSAGNISTMRPRQDLFSGHLSLIRPLAYLDKSEIEDIGRDLGLVAVRSGCPLREHTRRQEIHQVAEHIYLQIPGAKKHIFAALSNVRQDYLLKQTGGRRP